ncbi:hypothetical protein V1509DRAFT_627871 [Lipomyces kononenkoae]
MSFTSPTAKPFSPRHRPPPIQVQQGQTTKDKREPSVSFASSPAARASLLSNIRTRNENLGHPRTPYPPGFATTPKKQVYNESVYGVNHSSPSSSDEDIREMATAEERLDPRVYAALHAKQQELLATSQYIAQQQRIQLAMMTSAQQQLQLQYQQQQQGAQYYQDQSGNVWLMPPGGDAYAYSGVYGNYLVPSQQSSPRTGSPGSGPNMYGAEITGVQTQEFYSMGSVGNGSTASVNSSNGKAGKRKVHKKSSSLSSVQLAPHVQPAQAKKSGSPSPPSTQFGDYRVEVGSRSSSPSSDVVANGNGNVYAPVRQPMIPITLEELSKPANSELNFWSVDIARLCTSKEGRTERGNVVVSGTWETTWVDEDLQKSWGLRDEDLTAVSDIENGVNELSIEL